MKHYTYERSGGYGKDYSYTITKHLIKIRVRIYTIIPYLQLVEDDRLYELTSDNAIINNSLQLKGQETSVSFSLTSKVKEFHTDLFFKAKFQETAKHYLEPVYNYTENLFYTFKENARSITGNSLEVIDKYNTKFILNFKQRI